MLRKISEGLWCVDTSVRLPGGIIFPARMTVVDVADGRLLLHSPIDIDDELAAAIEALGSVEWIVAPNDQHHLYVGRASERFPGASVLATRGVQDQEPDLAIDAFLEDGAPDGWGEDVQLLRIDGTRHWNEVVFYLANHDTLLCSDLVFNIQQIANLRTGFLLWLIGSYRKLSQSRTERWYLVADREAYATSLQKLFRWRFERVIMAHGDIVEDDGRERLVEATAWAFKGRTVPQLEG